MQSCLHENDTAKDCLCNLTQLINSLQWSNLTNPTHTDSKNSKLTTMLLRRKKIQCFLKTVNQVINLLIYIWGKEQLFGMTSTLLGAWSKNFYSCSEMFTCSCVDVLHNCISRMSWSCHTMHTKHGLWSHEEKLEHGRWRTAWLDNCIDLEFQLPQLQCREVQFQDFHRFLLHRKVLQVRFPRRNRERQ